MKQGDIAKAKQSFQRIEKDFAGTQAAQEAKNYQKLLTVDQGAS